MQRTYTKGGTVVEEKYLGLKRLLQKRGVRVELLNSCPSLEHLRLLGIKEGLLTTQENNAVLDAQLNVDLEQVRGEMAECEKTEEISIAVTVDGSTRHITVARDAPVQATIQECLGVSVPLVDVLLGYESVLEGTFEEMGVEAP